MAIVRELRKLRPDVELDWIAGEPAATVLRAEGENVLDIGLASDTDIAESVADGYRYNLARFVRQANEVWRRAFDAYARRVSTGRYDLAVGDEAYGVALGYVKHTFIREHPFIFITDFGKNLPATNSPAEMITTWLVNRYWHKAFKIARSGRPFLRAIVFVGEPEDVPNERLGWFMVNARRAAESWNHVGFIVPSNPCDLADVQSQKLRLGYGSEKLILCSIGGTSIGDGLLDLCGRAYPLIRKQLGEVRMVLVAGPRLKPEAVPAPDGIEVRGFVPHLYEHFAACDLAIVTAGGTMTAELTALKRPFIFFPIEENFEQERVVVPRLRRHKAGVEMRYHRTTPQRLAETVVGNISKKVDYADMPLDGARMAAEVISRNLING